MNSDYITLSKIRFFGHHGVTVEEQERGQILEVTLRLEFSLAAAGRQDDLSRTVDYQVVYEVARAILEGPPRKLAETLAESVAADVLKKFKLVKAVEVEVTKPAPPVRFAFAGFSACVRREQVGRGKKDAMGSRAQAPQKRRAVASDAPAARKVRTLRALHGTPKL